MFFLQNLTERDIRVVSTEVHGRTVLDRTFSTAGFVTGYNRLVSGFIIIRIFCLGTGKHENFIFEYNQNNREDYPGLSLFSLDDN